MWPFIIRFIFCGVEVVFVLLFYFYLQVFPRRVSTIKMYSSLFLWIQSFTTPKCFLYWIFPFILQTVPSNWCLQPDWDNMITILTIPTKSDVTLSIGGANETGWIYMFQKRLLHATLLIAEAVCFVLMLATEGGCYCRCDSVLYLRGCVLCANISCWGRLLLPMELRSSQGMCALC